MSKNAYIIITDLHTSYKNKDSRVNYINEVNYCINKIISTGNAYKNRGYKVFLIFLGDISDNSYKDQTQAIIFNNVFVRFNELFEKIFAVLGNHELSYYKDNPFWSLLNKMDSKKITSVINRTWQPTGLLQLINVVDELEDGEVTFHFNHHATEINRAYGRGINIGLFHKDIISKAIIRDMEQNKQADLFEGKPLYFDKSNVFYGYDYAFMGHLHKVYGKWTYIDDNSGYKTILYYLASLGRPNHTEVNDLMLERNLPAVLVEDGKFKGVEDNKFNLPSREETVIEQVIKEKQKIYQENKEKQEIVKYLVDGDDPIQNIKNVLVSVESTLALFEEYVSENTSQLEHDLNNRIEDIKYI